MVEVGLDNVTHEIIQIDYKGGGYLWERTSNIGSFSKRNYSRLYDNEHLQ